MKVLLVQPPIEDFYTTSIRNYPAGLLFIASKLIDICEVEIIDLRQGFKSSIKSPFPHLNNIYNERISPFSLFSKYFRFGFSEEEIKRIIENKKPDLIGISAIFSTYFQEALQVAKIAKEVNSSIITVIGGNHPTLFPEDVLSYQFVDFVIRGEGEIPFRMLVEKIKNKKTPEDIPGVCYKKDNRLVIQKVFRSNDTKLDLKRELLDKGNYRYGKGYVAPVFTSRGCPHSCYFCGKPIVNFRYYNEDDVIKDIEKLIRLGYDTIDFEDDFFDITLPHTKRILSWLIGRNVKLTAMNGILLKIDEESKKLLKEAGFQRINLSVVDINKELQENIKREQFRDYEVTIDEFINTGIPIEVHFIIGLPHQSESNLLNTIIYLSEKKVLLGPSVYYMSPGSSAFFDHKKSGKDIDLKYARSSALYSLNFNTIKLGTYLRLTRFINFVKSSVDNLRKDMNIVELVEEKKKENYLEGEILEAFIRGYKFISYDKKNKKFIEDVTDKKTVINLLKKIRFIRGYKTENVCYFNI